ncbi:MAG: hypothetical protein ACK56F_14355 [bacterium]
MPRRHASADEATDSTIQDCVIAHALDNGSHWYANLRLCCARSTSDAIFRGEVDGRGHRVDTLIDVKSFWCEHECRSRSLKLK